MPAIRKSLLQLIFSGAYLLRWNDKLRPVELLEIDKQAHKMLLAAFSGTRTRGICPRASAWAWRATLLRAACSSIFTG